MVPNIFIGQLILAALCSPLFVEKWPLTTPLQANVVEYLFSATEMALNLFIREFWLFDEVIFIELTNKQP